MNVLVTGATGQLGTEWIHFLNNGAHRVVGLGSDDLDISNREDVYRIIADEAPDVVINCAAYTAVDDAEEHEREARMVNEIGVQYLAQACARNGAKLVHYSTDYVFEGSEEDQRKLPSGYDEEYPPNPQNVYGKSKRDGELAVERTEGNWLIIRVSWLCGQYGNNFVKTMLTLSGEKESLDVVNDQVGSPTFCTDVVEKTMKLIQMNQEGYVHVSSAGAITWYDLTKELLRITGSKTKLNSVSSAQFRTKAKRPAFSLLHTGKLKELGLEPVGWKEGLKQLCNQLSNSNTL